MELVKHETCLEYYKRRLSGGWECISLEGHNAVLLSPGGIRRELDLRNDIATLRPNADGDYSNIPHTIGGHYTAVDEVVADDFTTWVRTTLVEQKKDAYELEALPPAATVASVKIYFRHCSTGAGAYRGYAQPFLRLSGVETSGTEVLCPYYVDPGWLTSSETLARPGGGGWTPADIAPLQACVGLRSPMTEYVNLTQVYVEVDYTPPVAYEKTLTESLGLVDAVSKGVELHPLTEALGLLDTVTKSASIIKIESLGLEDRVSKHPSKALTEVLGLLDSVSYGKNLTVMAKLIRKFIQLESIGGGGER